MEKTISVAYALNKRGYTVEFLSFINSTGISYVMFFKEESSTILVIEASKVFSDEISEILINTEKDDFEQYISKYDSYSDYLFWKNEKQLYVLEFFIPMSTDFSVSQINLSKTSHCLLNDQCGDDNTCQGFILGKLGTSHSFTVL